MDKGCATKIGIALGLTVIFASFFLIAYLIYWLLGYYTDFPVFIRIILSWLSTMLFLSLLSRLR